MILHLDGTKKNKLSLYLIEHRDGLIHEEFKIPFNENEDFIDILDKGHQVLIKFFEKYKVQFDGKGIGVNRVFVNIGPGEETGILFTKELAQLLLFIYDTEALFVKNNNLPKNLSDIFFGSKDIHKIFIKQDKLSEMFFYSAMSLGWMMLESENYSGVIRISEKIRPLIKSNEDTLYINTSMLGFSYLGVENYKQAIKYLKQASKNSFAENDDGIWYSIGLAYAYNGMPDKAKISISKAVKINPEIKNEIENDEILKDII